jgi:hypothetical protein
MTEEQIRNSIEKTEYKQNGWQIVILESQNQTVKSRYELAIWETGKHNKTGMPFDKYRNNFIEGLTRVLVEKILYPDGRPIEEMMNDYNNA